MSESLALWSTIVGFLLPPVLAVVLQARWRPEVKGVVAFVACLIAATGTATIQGRIGDGTALTTSFLRPTKQQRDPVSAQDRPRPQGRTLGRDAPSELPVARSSADRS